MRVLTYNIRHGQGVGGLISNARIGRVISRCECDCVGLNEVWRAGSYDQPKILAASTGLAPAFHSISRTAGIELGNLALLARPVQAQRAVDLGQSRGCLLLECGDGDAQFAFGVTHLSLDKRVRRTQMEALAEELPRDLPLILVGDFNCGIAELGPLRGLLSFPENVPRTYPSVLPLRSLDHIGYSKHWRMESLMAVPAWASDHLPLLAELQRVASA